MSEKGVYASRKKESTALCSRKKFRKMAHQFLDRTLGEIFFIFTDGLADFIFGESFQIIITVMLCEAFSYAKSAPEVL